MLVLVERVIVLANGGQPRRENLERRTERERERTASRDLIPKDSAVANCANPEQSRSSVPLAPIETLA